MGCFKKLIELENLLMKNEILVQMRIIEMLGTINEEKSTNKEET